MRNIALACVLALSTGCAVFEAPDNPREAVYAANMLLDSMTDELRALCRKGALTRSQCSEAAQKALLARNDLNIANQALGLGEEIDIDDALSILDSLEFYLRAQ
jgi:hypothetical protein